MKINLPNKITIGRLGLAVVFFALLGGYSQQTPSSRLLDVCLVVFVIAALTDALDGYLARKHNQVTSLGRVLDPFVDKVLICGAFVFFAADTFVNTDYVNVTGIRAWMVVLILGRELLVTGLRGFTEAKGKAYGALAFGKLKMVMQSITAGYILFVVAHVEPASRSLMLTIRDVLIWATVVITTLSMLQYLIRSKNILSEASRP